MRVTSVSQLESLEARLCFSTFIGGGSGDEPHPIPPPTFANGVLHIRGTDFDDHLYIRTHDLAFGSGTDSLVLEASGGWRQIGEGERLTEQHYIVDTDRGPANTYYHAPASLLLGIVVETAGGADRIAYAPYLKDEMRLILIGGSGNDTLNAGNAAEATLIGGAGRDQLSVPAGGRSFFEGGRDSDTIYGSVRGDIIYGGDGDDLIYARHGYDTAYGAEGNDTLLGEADGDVLFGGWGQDYLDGGRGGDHLLGEDSNDFLEGGPDNDILDGGAGTDTLYGGDGNDYLIGGRGIRDSMRGGMGNDKFRADDILGNGDSMWGEAGFDVLVANADADDVFVRGPQTR